MKRRSVDEEILLTEEVIAAANASACGPIMPEGSDKPINFGHCDAWGPLGEAIATHMKQAGLRHDTLKSYLHATVRLFAAITEVCVKGTIKRPTTTQELMPLLDGVMAELQSGPKGLGPTANSENKTVFRILKSIVDFPIMVPDVREHTFVLPGWEAMDDVTAAKLLAAARSDIAPLLERHRFFKSLAAEIDDGSKTVPSTYEGLVGIWLRRFGGVPLYKSFFNLGYPGKWHRHVKKCGFKLHQIYSALYPKPEDLFPFLVIICGVYGLNLRGLLDLEVDALGLVDEQLILNFMKYRLGGAFMSTPVPDELQEEIEDLIATALEITAHARKQVAPKQKKFLWLVLKVHPNEGSWLSAMDWGNLNAYYRAIPKWRARHGLTKEDTRCLALRFRKFVAKQEYVALEAQSIDAQKGAIAGAARRLLHIDALVKAYAHACITDGDAVRAVKAFEASLLSRLEDFRATAS